MKKKRMAPRATKPFKSTPVELPTKKPNSSGVKIIKPKTGVGVKETAKKRNISPKPKKPTKKQTPSLTGMILGPAIRNSKKRRGDSYGAIS
jgi:hypothetical protein